MSSSSSSVKSSGFPSTVSAEDERAIFEAVHERMPLPDPPFRVATYADYLECFAEGKGVIDLAVVQPFGEDAKNALVGATCFAHCLPQGSVMDGVVVAQTGAEKYTRLSLPEPKCDGREKGYLLHPEDIKQWCKASERLRAPSMLVGVIRCKVETGLAKDLEFPMYVLMRRSGHYTCTTVVNSVRPIVSADLAMHIARWRQSKVLATLGDADQQRRTVDVMWAERRPHNLAAFDKDVHEYFCVNRRTLVQLPSKLDIDSALKAAASRPTASERELASTHVMVWNLNGDFRSVACQLTLDSSGRFHLRGEPAFGSGNLDDAFELGYALWLIKQRMNAKH